MNFKIPGPATSTKKWEKESQLWMDLNSKSRGNPEFSPLTVKGAYVFGLIHDLCESVEFLLKHPKWRETTFLPAYGVFCSAVELLGRCIAGNASSGDSRDLETGFGWLTSLCHTGLVKDYPIIQTSSAEHSLSSLIALRHFVAHGQAGLHFRSVDLDILHFSLTPLKHGLGRYWNILQKNESYCESLVLANVAPRQYTPVQKSWVLFERTNGRYRSIAEIWGAFDWPRN